MSNNFETIQNPLEKERQAFIEDGWRQTDYSSFFTEGDEARPEDFSDSKDTKDNLESKEMTLARSKAHSDTFIDVIYVKEGDFVPPNNSWSSREVYRVEDGHWKIVKKESV